MSARVKKLGLHRVDGRSYWFAAYFNPFNYDLMAKYAGQGRADRFNETFDNKIPFADAEIVKVYDDNEAAARQFADTFGVDVASTLDEFGEGLDGVIVPFPSGGELRDYKVTSPLMERGIPLFLDRLILEQSDVLGELFETAAQVKAPMLVTSLFRFLAYLLLPEDAETADFAMVSTAGRPEGYGADAIDLIDELMKGKAASVVNIGDDTKDILRIQYEDGRHAIVQLFHDQHPPMQFTSLGDGWGRSLQVDVSHFHLGAMRQFDAFLRTIETREPYVPYERTLTNAAILHAAESRKLGEEIRIDT